MSEKTDAGLLMSAIVKLADRGFGESEFRGSTAMAVERLIGKGVRIDQAIIDLYRQWLLGREETVAEVMDSSTDEEAPDQAATEAAEAGDPNVRSLLWGYGDVSIVPGGDYPVLEALVRIYLHRNDINELLTLLRKSLDRVRDLRCWKHLLMLLIYLRPAEDVDPTDRVALLRSIVDRFPELLGTRELAHLLGHVHWWSPDFVEEVLSRWLALRSQTARRGYGELVALLALLHPERDRPQRALLEIEQDGNDRDARAGAAMSAANLWSEHAQRDRATALLVRLLPDASEGEWAAVFDLFRIIDELTPDENTVLLLEAIADHTHAAPRRGLTRASSSIGSKPHCLTRRRWSLASCRV